MNNFQQKKNTTSSGFVVLFAMLISSLILLISSGMYTIVQKQVVLASYSKESQKAFYSADSALDCALYHDVGVTETHFPPKAEFATKDISCGGGIMKISKLDEITTGSSDEGGETFTYPYVFRYYAKERPGDGCAYVLVEKENQGGLISTRMTAAGFNVCTPNEDGDYLYPDIDNPTLVERRVSVFYRQNFSAPATPTNP